jgi:hypothetical protein
MIEVTFELTLDSLIINSMAGTSKQLEKMPDRSLNFACEKILSAQHLHENAPTASFEFLGSSAQREDKADADKEFDEHLFKLLSAQTTVDVARVNVASGASGYTTIPKGVDSVEMGRMLFAKLPNKSRLDIELVLRKDEFDAIWELAAGQKIQKVIATLNCFRLKQDNPAHHKEGIFVTGVFSSSLQITPRAGS